jgi:FtsP/CotA-like multicopper oxidase with cupredoxin domain
VKKFSLRVKDNATGKRCLLSITALLATCGLAAAQTALPIPPLLTPVMQDGVKTFSLNLTNGQGQIVPGLTSKTMGFNGSFLGPTIYVNEGDPIHLAVTNSLGEDATVHWHGLHLPAAYDGGIEEVIPSGTTWNPQYTIRQPASTNWYHPHIMGSTAKQMAMGLVGMFIINDNSSAAAALPHTYGVDDIPLILQSEIVGSDGTIKYDENTLGAPGDQYPLLVNGVNVASVPVLNTTQSRLRFRVLNASIGDVLTLSFTDGRSFSEVATDGGFLPNPLTVTSVRLTPAERAEIVVDVTGGMTLQATQEATLVAGGSGTHSIVQINPTGFISTLPPIPNVLNSPPNLDIAGATRRTIEFTGDATGFGINGVDAHTMADLMKTEIRVKVGTTELWDIVNTTGQDHDFHMHDGSFQIISVNGAAPSGDKVGWKDTVEVPPGQSVSVAMHFTDYSDANHAYMLHCHLAPHEDQGMMALFFVDPVINGNAGRVTGDFDGDGKSDYAIQRSSDGGWYVSPSSNPAAPYIQQWGLPGDVPVIADFDGDGKNDYVVWRPSEGMWYIKPSSNPAAAYAVQWGLSGDIPLGADFDGDGKNDYVVWRPSQGMWYIRPSSNPAAAYAVQWGLPGDVPLVGDFDSDGKLDFAVWRPSNGTWYIIPSSNPSLPYTQQWGLPGDVPLVGDFDGDGKNDYVVWRPSNGSWYIKPSSNPEAAYSMQWGAKGDIPIARDFDHDGKTDYAVWRPSSGYWFMILSSNPGSSIALQWGLPGDVPL